MARGRGTKRRRTDSDEPLTFNEKYETATKTNEEVLGLFTHHSPRINSRLEFYTAIQMEGWTSKVYKHFRDPVIIVSSGAVKYKFICQT
jgi:hypothetical protein